MSSTRSRAYLLLPLLVLVGCPKKTPPPHKRPDALVVHMETEPAHLLSMLRPDYWAKRTTSHLVFQSLLRIHPRTYEPEGELAATWRVSKDRLTYTFFLRNGVRWHDGHAFSGEDVVFTLDRLLDESTGAAGARSALRPYIQSYALIKHDELRIVCKKASPFFLSVLADLDILPAHLLARGELSKHPFLRAPVGTGPYRFHSWKSGQQIVLQRFEQYWGQKPAIGKLIYRVVANPDVALKLCRRGEIDFMPRVRPAQWVGVVSKDPVLKHEFIRTRHFPPGQSFVMLNHRRPLFSDVRVRRALAMLLDLDTIVTQVMHGIGHRVGSLYWFKDPHYDATIQPIPYDPGRAAKLLAQAGFSDSDGDGILDKAGRPFKFTFLVAAVSKSQQRWATIYQQALRKVGVLMDISSMDWSAYLDRIRKHDFDVGALGMRQTRAQTDLYDQLHSSQIKHGQNYSAYHNPEADRLLVQVRSEMDPEKRRQAALALQKVLARDVALIPLFAEEEPGIVSRRVHGVYTSVLWYQLRDWWIE